MGCALASQQAQRNEADCTQHDGVRNGRKVIDVAEALVSTAGLLS